MNYDYSGEMEIARAADEIRASLRTLERINAGLLLPPRARSGAIISLSRIQEDCDALKRAARQIGARQIEADRGDRLRAAEEARRADQELRRSRAAKPATDRRKGRVAMTDGEMAESFRSIARSRRTEARHTPDAKRAAELEASAAEAERTADAFGKPDVTPA